MKKIISLVIVLIFLFNCVNFSTALQINKKQNSTKYSLVENEFHYENKYAVIIVGTYGSKNQEQITGNPRETYYFYYTGSAMRRFTILNETYGFPRDNIFVLLTEIKKEGYNAHDTYDSTKFVNFWNSTTENITMVFNDMLPDLITENDILTVDLIGHGNDDGCIRIPFYTKKTGKLYDSNSGIDASDTFIPLEKPDSEKDKTRPQVKEFKFTLKNIINKLYKNNYCNNESSSDYKLYDYELKEYTFNLNARRIVFILQPCHSGGFINDLSKENHVIIASCGEAEVAGDFLGHFNDGLEGSADLNPKDGKISLAEAFKFGSDNIDEYYPDIYPLIDDNADKIGSVDLSGEDGKISAKIIDFSYEIN
jgi:hypothetical protein